MSRLVARNSRDEDERRSGDAYMRQLERRAKSGDPAAAAAYGRALRRQEAIDEGVVSILNRMGDEAWLAWVTDGEFEWRPETDEGGDSYAEQDYASRSWSKGKSVSGFAVRHRPDGSPMIVRTHWIVRDGNWDAASDDTWPVGSPQAELVMAHRRRDYAWSWVEYFAWIAGSYDDPLDELGLPERREPDMRWKFRFEQEQPRGRAGSSLIPGRVLLREAWQRSGRKWLPTTLYGIRPHVREWLGAEEGILSSRDWKTRRVAPALVVGFKSLEDVKVKVADMDPSRGKFLNDYGLTITIDVVIDGALIPPSDREISDAARAHEVAAGEALSEAQREVDILSVRVLPCEVERCALEAVECALCGAGHCREHPHVEALGPDVRACPDCGGTGFLGDDEDEVPCERCSETGLMPATPDETCSVCGRLARVDETGVSNHLRPDGEIDYEADASHVAVPEEQP